MYYLYRNHRNRVKTIEIYFFKFPAKKCAHKNGILYSNWRIADMFHCYQVRVKYSHQEFKEGVKADSIAPHQWVSLEREDNIEKKVRKKLCKF